MNTHRIATILLAVLIVHSGSICTVHADVQSDAVCRQRLMTIYDALKQYHEINEAMPATLFELIDFGLIDDPEVLFDPRGIGIGHHGQANLCTPFDIMATDLAGDLLVSDEPYEGRLFVLRANGSVVVRTVNVAEYYGQTPKPKEDEPIDEGELTSPSSGLGVIVDHREDQVVVRSIIPGYGTIEGRVRQVNDLRYGDRLINVEGRRVTSQADLEDYLRTIGPLETYGPLRPQVWLLRDGKLLRRRAMTPLIAINAQRTDSPSVVHHKAMVYLHSAGPGAMGIMADQNSSEGVGARVKSLASAEARAKLQVGDVITHVEDTPVNNVDQLNEQIRFHLAGMVVQLRILRQGESQTIPFKLQPVDAQIIRSGRFEIHRGRLDAEAALANTGAQLVTSVIVMLDETRGPTATLQWIDNMIANPTPNQKLQMPMILEARADVVAKLGWVEDTLRAYDKAAQAWGMPSGTWRLQGKKVELLVKHRRLDQARRLTNSWNLSEDVHARRTAMDVAYTYAAYGALSEATSLLRTLQNFEDMQAQAANLLKSLRTSPPTPRPENISTYDRDNLISEMVMAASTNDVQKLEILVGRASMGPDVLGREQTAPLLIAAARGHAQTVALLLNAGADANQRYPGWHSRGSTALIFATEAGHENIVYLLIKKGADINCAGGKGQTPLMLAAAQKKTAIVRALLEQGAAVNRTVVEREGVPYGGYTALMVAAMNGHEEIVRMLLEKGANPNLRGTDGMTARSLAEKAGHADIADLISDSAP